MRLARQAMAAKLSRIFSQPETGPDTWLETLPETLPETRPETQQVKGVSG